MGPGRPRKEQIARTVKKLRMSIRKDASRRWEGVKTAHRREMSRQVWRFTMRGESVERFLHIPYEAMGPGRDAAAEVMGQLRKAGWLDRLQSGPEHAFILSESEGLQPWPGK